ncbi:MAG: dihydrofolate reductase [Flavobacteriales bacterium]|nr:dihydrofolate reductase [Flavobacteriales bacterium]
MITIIVAYSENRIIGSNNSLLWKISDDLKRFKKLTLNHPIIMGRKTFDSLPNPLPKRQNIVISRNPEKLPEQVYGVDSLEKAIEKAKEFDSDVFIIGGGEIYKQALPYADVLEVTLVHTEIEGDTSFPYLDMNQWSILSNETFFKSDKNEYDFTFITYMRNK